MLNSIKEHIMRNLKKYTPTPYMAEGSNYNKASARLCRHVHREPVPHQRHMGWKAVRTNRLAGTDNPRFVRNAETERLSAVQHGIH